MTSTGRPRRIKAQGAGQQLFEGKRFAQVVVGAAVQAAHPVADGVTRCQEEHGRGPAGATMGLQDFEAVLTGQPPIKNDEVILAGAKRFAGRVAIGGVRDGEGFVREPVDDRTGEARIVFDDQNPLFHDHPVSCLRKPPPQWKGHRHFRLQHSQANSGRQVRQMKRILDLNAARWACAVASLREGCAKAKGKR